MPVRSDDVTNLRVGDDAVFWPWFHLFMTAMLAVASIRLVFEIGIYEGIGALIFTYLYWCCTYRRLAKRAVAEKESRDILDRLLREYGIASGRTVKGPDIVVAVNMAATKLLVIKYKDNEFERPIVFTPDEILGVHLSELTEIRKEESGGWTTGLAGALIGGFTGFLAGFLVGRETLARAVVTGYQVRITVRNAVNPVYYLNFSNLQEAEHWQGLLIAML